MGKKRQTKGTASKRVLILRTWSLIRTFLAFWVLIFTTLVSFTQRMSIQSACIHICRHRFRFTLLANFDFDLCWGSLLGPYFTKKWGLFGSLSQSLGVVLSFRDSENGAKVESQFYQDGPSAGVTIVTALLSLATNKPILPGKW